jgi:hypothetical protein
LAADFAAAAFPPSGDATTGGLPGAVGTGATGAVGMFCATANPETIVNVMPSAAMRSRIMIRVL